MWVQKYFCEHCGQRYDEEPDYCQNCGEDNAIEIGMVRARDIENE